MLKFIDFQVNNEVTYAELCLARPNTLDTSAIQKGKKKLDDVLLTESVPLCLYKTKKDKFYQHRFA